MEDVRTPAPRNTVGTEIRVAFPPNIDDIRARFELSGHEVFAWDGVIYNPSGARLPVELVAHEETHFRQQRAAGGPAAWWRRYLTDQAFRLDAELEAHAEEYRVFCASHGRPERRRFLDELARRLSSPTYGRMISTSLAKLRIKRAMP